MKIKEAARFLDEKRQVSRTLNWFQELSKVKQKVKKKKGEWER